MGLYQNNNGSLLPLAGRGKAEYGASTIRTGTVHLAILGTDERFADVQVTFSTPMPDANYEVELSKPSKAYYQAALNVAEKTANGFKITASSFINLNSTTWSSIAIDYVAYKLYTDNEYNGLLSLYKPAVFSSTCRPSGSYMYFELPNGAKTAKVTGVNIFGVGTKTGNLTLFETNLMPADSPTQCWYCSLTNFNSEFSSSVSGNDIVTSKVELTY